MRYSLLLPTIPLLTALAAAPAAIRGAEGSAAALRPYEHSFFQCSIPAGWSASPAQGQAEKEKKIYGIDLVGPAGKKGLTPSISVKYYAKGNDLFRTPKDYINIHSRPIKGLALKGDRYDKVSRIKVAGRAASVFDRKKTDFTGGMLDDSAVEVYERFIVVPAKGGFYALSYYSSFQEAKEHLPLFEAVLASFKPLAK